MRLLWWSNAPWTPTGYGTQTAQVIRRLRDDGHDVAVASNYGQSAVMTEWEGIPVYPGGVVRFSLDLVEPLFKLHRADALIGLYDSWIMGDCADTLPNVAWWTPVDHFPVPPKVAAWARKRQTIAMSRAGLQAFNSAGIDATYIPHGIDGWAPTPSDFRERNGIPADAFVVMVNAANQDRDPSRKAWPEMLLALSRLMLHRPDVWVYLHADLTRPTGVDIPGYMAAIGMDASRVRTCDQIGYRLGRFTQTDIAEAYTAADVLLATSMGEGFGLAVLEAMACGTPAIVTDATAQPELVGDTGWRVGWQPWWHQEQEAFWALPSVDGTLAALQSAYAERGTSDATRRSAAAIERAAGYDADRIYAERWRPFIDSLAGG
jgi:glycosyltransferase involved in cell wall biosynthesis